MEIRCDFGRSMYVQIDDASQIRFSEPKGCLTILPLEQLQQHLTKCLFNPDAEVICDKGCNIKMTRHKYEVTNCFTHFASHQQEQFDKITSRQRDEITKLCEEVGLQRENIMNFSVEVSRLSDEDGKKNLHQQEEKTKTE